MNLEKKLYRSKKNKMLGGVCGGIGEYFAIDPTLVRLATVALCIFVGGGLIAYIVALIIVPEAPEGYDPNADASSSHQEAASSSDGNSGDGPTLI